MTNDETVSILESALQTELVLHRPLEDVWPAFRDMRTWYTEYAWEIVSGPPYEAEVGLVEGQVIKVTSSHPFPRTAAANEHAAPDYFMTKIIKVVPPHEIVCVLWGRAFDWEDYTSFYIWRLKDDGTATTVSIDSVERARLAAPLRPDEFATYEGALTENWHRSWSTALAAFRALVEGT
jgi:hypothetical protein